MCGDYARTPHGCARASAYLSAQSADLRFEFFYAAPGLGLIAGEISLVPGPCPAIEQRCSNTQLRRYLGRAATAVAPQLQRFLFVLFSVSRLVASRLT